MFSSLFSIELYKGEPSGSLYRHMIKFQRLALMCLLSNIWAAEPRLIGSRGEYLQCRIDTAVYI